MNSRLLPPETAFKAPSARKKRQDEPEHQKFVKLLSCLVCSLPDHSDCSHIKFADVRTAKPEAGTMRPDDWFTVPLCRSCHDYQHSMNEKLFWENVGIDPIFVGLALWVYSGDYERGELIVQANRG